MWHRCRTSPNASGARGSRMGSIISPITAAVHAETMCQQSAIAMQLQRKLRWDPKAERFVNDEQANRMLSRAIRAPWSYTI